MTESDETITSEGRRLHALAEEAIEKQDPDTAHVRITEALVKYAKDNDTLGLAEAHASRFRAYRQQYEKTEDEQYAIMAKGAITTSVELARKSNDPKTLALPLFNLGKAYKMTGELAQAVVAFEEAASSPLPEQHDNEAVKADIAMHLATAQYTNGDRSALARADKAMETLINTDHPNEYEKIVWISGGHIRIAEMLPTDNPRSQQEWKKAATLVDNKIARFPELSLRQQQIATRKAKSSPK